MASIPIERHTPQTGDAYDGIVRLPADAMRTPAMIAQWDDLARQCNDPNPFFESWYLLPAIDSLAGSGQVELACLFVDGALAGLMPLARSGSYYGKPVPHLAAWSHPNAFCGLPLVAKGHERPFWRALFGALDRLPGLTAFLHLAELPGEGPMADALREVLAEQLRPSAIVVEAERAMLASQLSPEDYFVASMSGKKRKELRRQANRLAEEGELAFTRHSDTAEIAEWIEQFLALERAGWKGAQGSALGSADATAQLFRQALAGAAERGRLERLALTLDGRPIAMLANFITPPGAYSFKTAFDEDFARYSPGVLLQRENLTLLARSDIAWCDSCAAADHPMIERIWREKRRVTCTNIAIGGGLRRTLFRQLARIEARGQIREF